MCPTFSGSVHHFDVALPWQFTNHDDFALMVSVSSLLQTHHISFFQAFLEPYTLASLTPLSWTFPRVFLPAYSQNVLLCLKYIAHPYN